MMIGTNEPLTIVELAILGKFAIGKTHKEIRYDTHMSKLQLDRLGKSIRKKAGADNMTAAVYVYAKNNVI